MYITKAHLERPVIFTWYIVAGGDTFITLTVYCTFLVSVEHENSYIEHRRKDKACYQEETQTVICYRNNFHYKQKYFFWC